MQIFLIVFREGIEAALIVGIVLAYLSQTDRAHLKRFVWWGVALAGVGSLVVGGLIATLLGSLEKNTGRLMEGILCLLAAAMLSWMIVWMHKHARGIGQELRDQVDTVTQAKAAHPANAGAALTLLSFVAVGREGIETVLFLFAFGQDNAIGTTAIAATAGLVLAIVLGVALNRGIRVLDLGRFFRLTGVLLIFFAAGLVAYGIHELQDAGAFPVIIKEMWNINHIINDKQGLGVFLKALLGYNGNPSLLETLAYSGFLTASLFLFLRAPKNTAKATSH